MDELSQIQNDVAEAVASEFMDEIEKLRAENEQLRELACERCKKTGIEYVCKCHDVICVAYKY